MTHQQVFDEFIRMAKAEREKSFLKFNEKTSCLKHMVIALRDDIRTKNLTKIRFEQIRNTLELKSPKDSRKYQNALNYVAIHWPNWNRGVRVMPQVGVASQLRTTPRTPPRVPPRVRPTGMGIVPIGWEYVSYNRRDQPWTAPLTPPEFLPELNKSEITRINESLKRAKYAVEVSRDALIRVNHANWVTNINPDQQLYIDFFGAYNQDRFKRVLNNYKVLYLAFQNGPKIIDLRNTIYGKTCYAACFRHDLRTIRDDRLALKGKVDMFLGRSFLSGTSSYKSSTDSTVGTLIHEFSHGAINAVDAPPVIGGVWQLIPNLDPNDKDYGASPDNSVQASTTKLDKDLAAFAPAIAIRNADNYGQFASAILMRSGK